MPDFTCALYLGLRHPAHALRPWTQLTTGAPAAVRPVPGAAEVARRLAALQGSEAATLLPATLHVAWDLGGLVDPQRDLVHIDADAYPVLGAAATRAAARGVQVRRFAHHDPASLRRAVRTGGRRPIVIVDGLCPACGGPAPLSAYLDAVRPHAGWLVVDDTQSIGILGAPAADAPQWGRGGGGSLRFHGLSGASDVLIVASMAKALGAPVAAISGPRAAVAAYEARSGARVHCSPVSVAVVHALAHALDENRARGDALRDRLRQVIERFRAGVARIGVGAAGGPFPVQALPALSAGAVARLHDRLLAADVRTIVQAHGRHGGRIVFLLTARHTAADVDAALEALAGAPEALARRRTAAA